MDHTILVIALAALFYTYKKQKMEHQERMAALEKNIQPPTKSVSYVPAIPSHKNPSIQNSLQAGVIGFVMGITIMIIRFFGMDPIFDEVAFKVFSLVGLMSMGMGTAYLIFYWIVRQEDKSSGRTAFSKESESESKMENIEKNR